MAPSRRKGASKAASAAARRKWKVGDPVLAKVKGYPAWPAIVDEPEKWGYPADSKKILVYFFGTQQIAFCNPADVEDFTEEKKVYLLGKRYGKGSDFGRAVKEIVDCFEKLKRQDQVSSANDTEETNITNENNSDESLTKSVKDEAPVNTVDQLSTGATNDLNSLTEAAVAAAAEDALHDEEMQLEEAHSDFLFAETRMSTTYSTRSRTDVARSRNSGTQKRTSTKRLRISSRIGASRLRNLIMPGYSRSSRRLADNVLHDRSRRIMKSSDDSEGNDVDSPACVSNDSLVENDSEVMTVDSDTSLNDGSTVDSGCNQVGEEPLSEHNMGETELSDRLDFQSNTVISKKKRKPNRKRHRNDTVPVAKLDDIVVSEAEMLKTDCASPSNNENFTEKCAKEEGDEHLPLVKRARVRMGRPSPEVTEEGTLLNKEEKTLVFDESHAIQSSGPLKHEVGPRVDEESALVKGDPGNSSLSPVSPARRSPSWETKKNLVDGEAALPPSKRLHRALEAMSANVAEDSQIAASCSPTVNIHSNGGWSSSFVECSDLSMGNRAAIELGPGAAEDHSNCDSQSSASEFIVGSNIERSENDKKTSVEAADRETDAQHQHVKSDEANISEELARLDCKIELSDLNQASMGFDPDISHTNSGSILVEKLACGSVDIGDGIPIDSVDVEADETPNKKHISSSENNQDKQRSEFVEEARPPSADSNVVPSATSMKVLISSTHQCMFQSNSNADDHLEDRIVSVTQSSSSLTDGPDSGARASPPSSSICNVSVSDNNNSLENNSSSSPDFQLHLEKAKLASNSSSKGESLSSFEAIIQSLTRTKESIGRATRIAIDSAKSGFATKVVEILACKLESESSLHKKVDLFFLVDSITQCSRGMKGDGGIYPSTIQAMLPRLLLAAAPPGSTSHENHRQCLKVLRVWQERKILPEPIIRHHIRELDALCGSYPNVGSRRAFRNERAFDDPIREMEGMLVDEYGSNSSIQLPGFSMPPMLTDDGGGSDSDGESFEAVTPEHNVENHDGETTYVTTVEKRSHILEDVDVEFEMEDVAPCCEVEITSTSNVAGADGTQILHHQSDNHYGASIVSQQPKDAPPISAPLPPPPLSLPPPPPPPSVYPPAILDSVSNCPDIKQYPINQNYYSNAPESRPKHSFSPRVKPRSFDSSRHRKDFEAQVPRQMPDTCSFSDQPTSHLSSRAPNSDQPVDGAYSKGFHLRPPHPAPSNQFSYVQEQRNQSRRDIPPPSHPNRFHSRNADNGNFYRDRDRHKFGPRDNIGEYWRPPLPSVSGSCYRDGSRMAHAPYNGPPREPVLHNNRWNYPPRPMNHREYDPYRPPSEGPISVINKGPNFWKSR